MNRIVTRARGALGTRADEKRLSRCGPHPFATHAAPQRAVRALGTRADEKRLSRCGPHPFATHAAPQRAVRALALAAVAALFLAACGSDAAEVVTAETAEEGTAASAATACDQLDISGEFVRLPPAENTALYFTVTNNSDIDTALVGADADIAGVYELHEHVMNDGQMTMQPVEGSRIDLPAGGSAVLEPGGFHVMAIGLTTELAEGDEVSWTLEFEGGCTKAITASVRAVDMMMDHEMDDGDMDHDMDHDHDADHDMDDGEMDHDMDHDHDADHDMDDGEMSDEDS